MHLRAAQGHGPTERDDMELMHTSMHTSFHFYPPFSNCESHGELAHGAGLIFEFNCRYLPLV